MHLKYMQVKLSLPERLLNVIQILALIFNRQYKTPGVDSIPGAYAISTENFMRNITNFSTGLQSMSNYG